MRQRFSQRIGIKNLIGKPAGDAHRTLQLSARERICGPAAKTESRMNRRTLASAAAGIMTFENRIRLGAVCRRGQRGPGGSEASR